MPINGYFDVLFASGGSKVAVPDGVQPDGSVSYTQGYGVNYTLDPATNPSALNVEETKMNQLFYDVTSALQQYQQWGIPPFITSTMNNGSPFSYPKYAMALESGVAYMSLVASNADVPPSPKWMAMDFRRRLTGATIYYVSTSGDDVTGDGTSGLPWATIQHAVDFIEDNVDTGGFNVQVNVADGTYTVGAVFSGLTGGGTLTLNGNTTTPANCVISTTGANCIDVSGPGFNLQGFRLTTATSGHAVNVGSGGKCTITGAMNFGAVAAAFNHINNVNGLLVITTNYSISGGASSHIFGQQQADIGMSGSRTTTISGTPAFPGGFISLQSCSVANFSTMTYSGSATGQRYVVQLNGVIQTSGGGANFFPGNSAGATATGGQYV